jgi:arginine:pyruvate transaminase
MLFGLPGFVQAAALTALGIAPEAERRTREFCRARQERFAAGLRGIRELHPIEPEAGMFMLLDVSATGLSGGEFVRALYASQKVSVMDGAAFGAATAGCVRVCFATDEASIDTACERIRRFCTTGLAGGRAAAGR